MARSVKRTPTLWARLAVGYHRDPKVLAVGPLGEAAFVRLLTLAREHLDQAPIDGAVDLRLARRELADIGELYEGGMPALIRTLDDAGLTSSDGRYILVRGYADWQTTRDELDSIRADARARQAAWRARRDDSTDDSTTEGDKDMGVYDKPVEAFADLREEGAVHKGRTKVGKHGLLPAHVTDAERVIEHFKAKRTDVLGGGFRVTDAWWTDTGKLLAGGGERAAFSAGQLMDLIDFALTNRFWHAHCQTPAGLVKHGMKLFNSDEYVGWSKSHKRPAENRPRNNLIADAEQSKIRGKLAADEQVDWSTVDGRL